jgi:phosphate starvation-inducible protein PhoH and related proteins
LPAPVREIEFSPEPVDNRNLANLCGPLDQNLRELEQLCNVRIARRADKLRVGGSNQAAEQVVNILRALYVEAKVAISVEKVRLAVKEAKLSVKHRACKPVALIYARALLAKTSICNKFSTMI